MYRLTKQELKMAGKAKSCYLTVCPQGSIKSVLNKMFFTAAELNKFINSDEFKEKYPADQFQIIKEVY
jgi:hypothetical protein